MNESENKSADVQEPVKAELAQPRPDAAENTGQHENGQRDARRWWIKLFVQPALLLACAALVIFSLGVAQRLGFISSGGGGGGDGHAAAGDSNTRYICPMMCTPPLSEPGRCPVCGMELVPITASAGEIDPRAIRIDPVARRVANIQTVVVKSMPMTQTLRAVGELNYDEGSLKTISAYVDGRIEKLYADYTGVEVEQGDDLALIYSPKLYSAQVEFLLAKKTLADSRSSTLTRVVDSNRELHDAAKQRLIELGMTAAQIQALEVSGEANSRLELVAPISGTVIEKLAVEGQYVKEGQPIYRLAGLSNVWLMLKLFPEQAATIRPGQQVTAEVQSLPGRTFTGRVIFVDPMVDTMTRTVGVRVVIPNDDGLLRIGDYAQATLEVPVVGRDSADALSVPRNAVLMAGGNSVLYVETEPGRFEIRRVTLGPTSGDRIVILDGVKPGEQVATRGNFLIDSQMQLAGNPSLIDPTRVEPRTDKESPEAMTPEVIAALSKLSPKDRQLAESQIVCPVTMLPVGSMGVPPKVDVNGQPIFICCEGCRKKLLDDPEEFLAKLVREAEHGDAKDSDEMDLPPIGEVKLVEPENSRPRIVEPDEERQNN